MSRLPNSAGQRVAPYNVLYSNNFSTYGFNMEDDVKTMCVGYAISSYLACFLLVEVAYYHFKRAQRQGVR